MDARTLILSLPDRFRPEKAAGLTTCVHLDLGGPGGGAFTVTIAAGQCQVQEGLHGEARCTVRAQARHYLAIETGDLNPQVALFTGKLKVTAPAELMRFSRCFRRYRPEAVPQVAARTLPPGPLSGIRVLDFTRLLPGPLATLMLAEQGAEVIKIEHPDRPDYVREAAPALGEASAYYYALNRSKRSLTLAYDQPAGRQAVWDLLPTADLVVEQFRPGAMAAWGLDFATARTHNPRIAYVSLTGYGQDGPFAGFAGHDLNYLAWSGLLSQLAGEQGRPVIPGFQLADVGAGSYLCHGACTSALLQVARQGTACHLEVSMTEGLLPLHSLGWAAGWASGDFPEPREGFLSGGLPTYDLYATADGRWVALAALEPKFWAVFCAAVGHPEWGPAIVPAEGARVDLRGQLAACFGARTLAAWTDFALAHPDACVAPVLLPAEALDSPQARARGVVVGDTPEARGLALPIRTVGQQPSPGWIAPGFGADNIAILQALGYDDAQIALATGQAR